MLAGRKTGKTYTAFESALKLSLNPAITKILLVEPTTEHIKYNIKPSLKETNRHIHKTTLEQRQKIVFSTPKSRKHVGQQFDAIILDDVFFGITIEEYNNIINSLRNSNGILAVFATPPQKRYCPVGFELLKKLSLNPQVYKLHIPSKDSSFWNQEFLDASRKGLDENGYKSEIEAEFVD
jgi:hypothetical protein